MSVTSAKERLAAITAAGTSIWLDQISRGMIASGELARMVEEDHLRGVTSNPAIFQKAILGTGEYDELLEQAEREGLSAREVYRRLAVGDVQAACDVLAPVHVQTGGLDGYVSLEVAPRLAHDTAGTLEQARLYHRLVDRPNLMVKIPATEEGIPAIEQALYEGINVNVTLLFGVAWYRRVMEAFIRAMERRLEEDKPLDVHSVASFFVSRVDSEVDRRLDELGREDLKGRAALANARAAYRAYKETFHGGRFAHLRDAGCPVQRPLWASTGVKSPQYDPGMYVHELLGPETVNTMPLPTLEAVAAAGDAGGATAELDPQGDLDALRAAGIDLDDVTEKLLQDGIGLFVDAMNALIAGIDERREARAEGAISAGVTESDREAIDAALDRAGQEDVLRRVWRRDGTLWAPEGTPEVTDRLGWLTSPERMHGEIEGLREFTEQVRGEGLTDVLLLGMGGSSLAPEVFARSYAGAGALALHVLDTTEPITVREHAERLDPARTLVIVSTKSGGTIETLSLFKHFWRWAGEDGARFAAITDPGSGLETLAREHGFRRVFLNDPEIGGRYSALSFFGLVPAALAGVDVDEQLNWAGDPERDALWLGCAMGSLARRGRDKVTFLADAPLESFGLWVEQLIAESTGKQGLGTLPVADEPLAEAGRYGDDRVFVHIRNAEQPDARHEAFMTAVAGSGHPAITIPARGPGDLGRLFFLTELATAICGWELGINPFDQPNVQEAKTNTGKALEGGSPPADGTLEEVVAGLAPPAYLAIMGYLPYSTAVDAAVERLRAAVLEATGTTTTWGYGPRFLHSTGQYHKGGPATGRFLQLVHDSDADADVPGEAYGFRRLITAQADGDLTTLREHGLPSARVRLPAGDLASAIDELTNRIRGML